MEPETVQVLPQEIINIMQAAVEPRVQGTAVVKRAGVVITQPEQDEDESRD